jgi:hypothetical protein
VVLYYSLQTFYKYKSTITQPTEINASHRIAVFSSHAFVFVLQLATFLPITKHHHSTNKTQRNASNRSVVISCVWFCITACKLLPNTKASSLNQQRATHRSKGGVLKAAC